MSSSSAYNNVLLKSPVQTQASAVPKRDFQNDYSGADFNQTFNDVQKVSRKDEKHVRAVADRKPAENRMENRAAEPHRKPAKESVREPERESVKESGRPEKNSRTEANRSNEEPVAKDKKITQKVTAAKEIKNPENEGDDLTIPLIPDQLLSPQSNTPEMEVLNSLAPIATDLASQSGVSILGESELEAASLVASATSELIAVAPVVSSTSVDVSLAVDDDIPIATATLELKAGVAQSPSEIKASTDVNVTAEKLVASSETVSTVVLDAPKINPEKTPAEAAQPIVATLTANNALSQKNLANPVVGETAETSEDVLGALISEVVAEKASAKSAKDATTQVAAGDVETQAPVAQDAKSVFEKMLQTVARGASREETVVPNPAPNNSLSPNSNALDSFARFNDAQTPAARSFVVQTAVPVPLGQPQWSQAVGEKVLWLAAQNVSSAEINLHPKDLGPMQVKVSVNQEQTSVSFTSHHPMVREVLDQNLNRLRDMFSEQGLNLVNVDVSDKSFSRQQGDAQEQKGQASNKGSAEEESVTAVTTIVQQRLVDHYA